MVRKREDRNVKEYMLGYLEDRNFLTPGIRVGDPMPLAKLPTIENFRNIAKADQLRFLYHYGMAKTWGHLQMQAMSSVERMYELTDPDEFIRAIEELKNNQVRQVLELERRVVQRWTTLDAIDGDTTKELMWIAEDDKFTCENCLPRSGEIDTFEGWAKRGNPGASVCLGGDSCRCDLVLIE